MSSNLVSETKNHIDNKLIHLINRAIEGTDSQTQSAIDNIIPAFLNIFLDIVANKLGAEALFQGVDAQNDSVLDHLHEQLNEDKHKAFIESGAYYLKSLLGMRKIKKLNELLMTRHELSQHSSSSLLSILIQILLPVIKRKLLIREQLTTPGLIQLLKNQEISFIESRLDLHDHENNNDDQKGIKKKSTPMEKGLGKERIQKPSILKRLWPLWLLLALFFAYYLFLKIKLEPMQLPKVTSVEQSKASQITMHLRKH